MASLPPSRQNVFRLLYSLLLWLRYRLGEQESEVERLYLELDDRSERELPRLLARGARAR